MATMAQRQQHQGGEPAAGGPENEGGSEVAMEGIEDEYEMVQRGEAPQDAGATNPSDAADSAGKGRGNEENERGAANAGLLAPEELIKLAETDPSQAVKMLGIRLELKWSSGKWYRGTICEYNGTKRKHKVMYDDGDVRWYDLKEMIFRFVDEEDEWVKC